MLNQHSENNVESTLRQVIKRLSQPDTETPIRCQKSTTIRTSPYFNLERRDLSVFNRQIALFVRAFCSVPDATVFFYLNLNLCRSLTI